MIYILLGQTYQEENDNPECYAIIAGEVIDRFLNKKYYYFAHAFQNELPRIHKTFFDCHHIDDCPNGQTISNSKLSLLENNEIDIVKCRPQAHDGASAMSGSKSGAASVIKNQPQLLDTNK